MTVYNTGNPVGPNGSADPRDLNDNAKIIDVWATSKTELTHPDRLGVERKTWHGMEEDFQDFLINSGYEFIGDYAAGIEITARNQIIRDSDGDYWRVSGATSIPYTTGGSGLPEGGAFVNIGEAILRQDLAEPLGALNVGGVGLSLASIKTILTPASGGIVSESLLIDGLQVTVKGYYPGLDFGGGTLFWKADEAKSNHNGVTIFSPTVPWDGTQASISSFLSGAGETDSSGTGCWIRVDSPLSFEMGGALGDGISDDKAAFEAVDALGRPVMGRYGATYLVGALASSTETRIYSLVKHGFTIKLKDGENEHLFTNTGVIELSGVVLDYNRQGQTNRLKSCIYSTGTKINVSGTAIKNTMFAGIHVANAAFEILRLKESDFEGMAEASGVQGEQTQAVNCRVSGTACEIDISGCRVLAETPSDVDAAPGGFIFDVVDASLDVFARAHIRDNYFRNIGQRKSFGTGTHYIGAIDFYTNVEDAIVESNTIDTYYYVPIKLQNCRRAVARGNIINGNADAAAGQAMVFQNARDHQNNVRDWTCSGNIIRLSGRTNDGIYVQGDPDGAYATDSIVIDDNDVYGAQYGINLSYVTRATIGVKNIDLCVYGIYIHDVPGVGQVKYTVNGGQIINANSRGVYVAGNSSNHCKLNVSAVTFEDCVSFNVDTNYAKDVVLSGLQFDNTDNSGLVDDIRIENGTMAVVTGCSNGTTTANLTMAAGTLKQAGNSWL